MADKQIVELPIVELPELNQVTNETLIPVYQPGAMSNAQKMTGLQFRSFAEQAGAAAGEQAAGDLARGGTFTPHFNKSTGLLSWTNDLGLPNPDPVQLAGVSSFSGRTGAIEPQSGDYTAAQVGAMPGYRYSAELSAEGWYRIGHFNARTYGNQILVSLGNIYNNNTGHGVTALITTSQTRPSIVILNSNGTNVVKKFRMTTSGETSIVVEFYYGTSNINNVTMNVMPIKVTGSFTLDNFMPSDATDEYGVQTITAIPSGNVLTDGMSPIDFGAFPRFRGTLNNAVDCNDLVEDGIWVYSTSSVPENAPFANAAVIMCLGSDSTTSQRIQLAWRYGEPGYFKFRALYNSWQNWAEIFNSTNGMYEKIWENASKTSSFAEQTISLDTNAYDYLMVVCAYNITAGNGATVTHVRLREPGSGATAVCLASDYITSSGTMTRPFRKLTVASGRGSVTFGGGCKYDGTASDSNVIPYYIYGIKGVYN